MTQSTWLHTLNQLLLKNIKSNTFTNADLAEQMYMSERAFYRKIRQETGYTPNHYIRRIRLQTAKELLVSGEYENVKEVANQVGFAKVSYFSQLFEQTFGKRPANLLKKAKNWQIWVAFWQIWGLQVFG